MSLHSSQEVAVSTIFVKTAGAHVDAEFRWLPVDASTNGDGMDALEDVQILDEQVDDTAFGVMLAQKRGADSTKWTALVYNLESARKDFLGRPIRNAVAITGENSGWARKVVYWALTSQKELAEVLDSCISEGPRGIVIDPALLERLEEHRNRHDPFGSADEPAINRAPLVGAYASQVLRSQLAKDVLRVECAENAELVVVVDRSFAVESSRKKRVWRTLTSECESEEWVPLWKQPPGGSEGDTFRGVIRTAVAMKDAVYEAKENMARQYERLTPGQKRFVIVGAGVLTGVLTVAIMKPACIKYGCGRLLKVVATRL